MTGSDGVVRLVFLDCAPVRAIASGLDALRGDPRFVVGGGVFKGSMMDAASVAYAEFEASGAAFAELVGEGSFGLRTGDFKAGFKGAKGAASLEVGESAVFACAGAGARWKRSYSVVEAPVVRELLARLKPSASAVVPVEAFTAASRAAGEAGDSVSLQIVDGRLSLRTQGELSSFEAVLDVERSDGGDAKSRYNVEFLEKLLSLNPGASTMELAWGADYPLRLVFDAAPWRVACVLAPRVDNN